MWPTFSIQTSFERFRGACIRSASARGERVLVADDDQRGNVQALQNALVGRPFGSGVGRAVKADMEIVGIVRDSKYSSMRDAPPPVYYVPYRQGAQQTGLTFYVRTAVDPVAVAPVAGKVLQAVLFGTAAKELPDGRSKIGAHEPAEPTNLVRRRVAE